MLRQKCPTNFTISIMILWINDKSGERPMAVVYLLYPFILACLISERVMCWTNVALHSEGATCGAISQYGSNGCEQATDGLSTNARAANSDDVGAWFQVGLCNPLVTKPVTRNFDALCYMCLNKRLSKQSWGWWFETPSGPLRRNSNDIDKYKYIAKPDAQ